MNKSHTKLGSAEVLDALYTILEFRGDRHSLFTIPANRLESVAALVYLDPDKSSRITGEWLTTTAIQHAREWVAGQNVNDALDVLVAIKALDAPLLFEGLYSIANSLRAAERPWLAAHVSDNLEAMIETAKTLNDLVRTRVEDIARITSNSVSSINSFSPKTEWEVWFGKSQLLPSKTIRNVALYGTFNSTRCAEKDKAIAHEALLSRATAGATPMAIPDAVSAIKRGQVPTILSSDSTISSSGFLGALEREMLRQKVVKTYSEHHIGAISTTAHIAFVQQQPGKSPGEYSEQFVFWPANWARNHIEYLPMPAPEDDCDQQVMAAPAAN
ncbi:hypothetical protein [Polaromonas sp.]|uniref:hypothetical protein n=1 Tax=Polaromonas sp. TaxID=1869339 RepID=UPI00352B639D